MKVMVYLYLIGLLALVGAVIGCQQVQVNYKSKLHIEGVEIHDKTEISPATDLEYEGLGL